MNIQASRQKDSIYNENSIIDEMRSRENTTPPKINDHVGEANQLKTTQRLMR
jgi:hypothetical protein